MGRLIYGMIASLDGYIEDESGKFDWAAPDDELHAYVNERERRVGTYLYGRRMYEMMSFWETDEELPPVEHEYAQIWKAAEKIVYSTTLAAPSTQRTRIERGFDPEAVRRLVEASSRDVSVSGPELAAHAFRAGLVDECSLYVMPYVAGGGKPCFPRGVALRLELLEERRFRGGALHLRYRMAK